MMKLSDLKTGMIVKVRNNSLYRVFLDSPTDAYPYRCVAVGRNIVEEGFLDLSVYGDNLNSGTNQFEFDIMEVYRAVAPGVLCNWDVDNNDNYVCIWEREENDEEVSEVVEWLTALQERFTKAELAAIVYGQAMDLEMAQGMAESLAETAGDMAKETVDLEEKISTLEEDKARLAITIEQREKRIAILEDELDDWASWSDGEA